MYLDNITPLYENVIKLFYDSMKEDKIIENLKRISNGRKVVDRSLMKIQSIIERVQTGLSVKPSDLDQSDTVKLEIDVSVLKNEVNGLLGEVSSLGELAADISDLESKVDKIIGISEQLTRDANVLLKLSKLEPRASAQKLRTHEAIDHDLSYTLDKELYLSSSSPISTVGSNNSLKPDTPDFIP